MTLKLNPLLGRSTGQRWFAHRLADADGIRIQVEQKVALACAGVRDPEQAVIQAHLEWHGMARAQPVDIAFDLA